MLFNLKNEYDVPKFKAYVNRLYQEKALVEVKKKSGTRTLSQNAYLHLLLGYFGARYGCSADEVKVDFYKRRCNADLFIRTRLNPMGVEVSVLRSTTELTSEEMALSITRFRNWSSSEAGIYLPEAHEREALIHAQQEVERYREFI